jgi:DNA-directed RNA polymerase specialized sigma24 family protein
MDDGHHDSPYQQLIHKLFENRNVERDTRELLLYTIRKHGRRAYVCRDPDDYPNEAILRTLDGRRPFDFAGEKTLIQHLESSIDSILSHDLEKAARHVPLVDRCDIEDGTPLGGYDSSRIIANDHTELDVIAQVDAEKLNATLPPEERQYEELRRAGTCRSARDFAKEMRISEKTVRNIERRLARKKRKRK